ncbi:hypothetical protein HK098_000105 [Nowakowskiella sp. JEL0407]|nr:hypothetical protein HK098_000105 [Nowakowskiella sp. JEL0407]
MFGSGTSAFGSQPASQPAFGGFGTQPTTPATSAPAFGGFGTTNTTATTPSTGLFGSTAPSTGIFGSTATTSAPSTGLFGSSTAAPSTNLFGAKTTTAPTTGLFGASTAAPSTGLFGSATTTQPTLFGASTTQPLGASTFGSQPAANLGGSMFANQPNQAAQSPHIAQLMEQMKMYWHPESPLCHFRHYFYNFVHPNEAKFYVKPANHDETLWQQAMNDNPDPTCMVPVLATGFGDIKKRMEHQEAYNTAHKAKLEEIRERLDQVEKVRHLETTVKLKEYQRRHMQIAARVLMVMKKLQVLRNLGYSIRAEEENLRVRLESMILQLKKPSQFRGRISELAAQVHMLKESGGLVAENVVPGLEIDDLTTKLIYEALSEEQTGLAHLTEIVVKDSKDLERLETMKK